mmetsp:Transcript_20305/g.48032  ORF Transcript_20305/g.48032 Transcript_20305/m.48032 type:complete len:135 (+) Transcript_20305:862-1266(+)
MSIVPAAALWYAHRHALAMHRQRRHGCHAGPVPNSNPSSALTIEDVHTNSAALSRKRARNAEISGFWAQHASPVAAATESRRTDESLTNRSHRNFGLASAPAGPPTAVSSSLRSLRPSSPGSCRLLPGFFRTPR